jgi:hypothetical protein
MAKPFLNCADASLEPSLPDAGTAAPGLAALKHPLFNMQIRTLAGRGATR